MNFPLKSGIHSNITASQPGRRLRISRASRKD
jgi:hypothetical protein